MTPKDQEEARRLLIKLGLFELTCNTPAVELINHIEFSQLTLDCLNVVIKLIQSIKITANDPHFVESFINGEISPNEVKLIKIADLISKSESKNMKKSTTQILADIMERYEAKYGPIQTLSWEEIEKLNKDKNSSPIQQEDEPTE
jgi:hypothetical protein